MAHFQIQDLSFTFPGHDQPTLENIDLTIEKGSFVLLCGKSGSGKTTLLRHLKPALTPHGSQSGSIVFDGTPLQQGSNHRQAAKIGFVMQDPDDQIVTDQVWHELAFGLESLGCKAADMRLRVAEMASYFGIQDWFHRDTASLSGGQKQLLNLASIMVMEPDVLILDEPTSQLDPIAATDFLNTVRRINEELGTTVIITEHRLEEIYPHADQVVVMEDGKIIANGTPAQVAMCLQANNSDLCAALPTPVRVFCAVSKEKNCPLTVRQGQKWLSDTLPASLRARALDEEPITDVNAALSLQDLWFRYEKESPDILRGLSVKIPEGSLFAIVGANGAGKSTLLKVLCGVCKPYRGNIRLLGRDIKKYRSGELFRNGIAMLPQDPKSLFVKHRVKEELQEMCNDPQAIEEVASLCGLSHIMNAHPQDLSGGEQQRTALAKVLLTKPRLLLLDEPTKGLDNTFKKAFASLLHRLTAQGITVVMVSHDIEFCAQYAHLVGLFFDGQILTTNTPRQFFSSSRFYTTAAHRMSRGHFANAITAADVVALYWQNQEGSL